MLRGSKEGIEDNRISKKRLHHGFFHEIAPFKKLCKDNRLIPSKTILRGLGATKNSWVAWKVEDDSVFVTGINPDKFTELDIPEHEGMIVLKVIDEMGNYECNKDGDIYVLQVKSQGRLGTRNQVSEILSKAGIKEDDWIIAEYVDSKTDGMGWRLYGLGQKDLLYMLKKKRGETNAEISTT